MQEIELEKIRTNRETGEEFTTNFSLYKEDILCLYKDRTGTYIVTKPGFMDKVPYKFSDLKKFLDIK
jgi:hypothetical protein